MGIILQIIGLFLGVFTRTYLPYIRKLKREKSIAQFKRKYFVQAVYAVIFAFISVMLIIPENLKYISGGVDWVKGIKIFTTAFSFGFAWNSLINEGHKWVNRR